MASTRSILFTAFEPSGDALAAPLIAELKRREPSLSIHALGGPKMAAAGAELLETTTEHAAMGARAATKVFEHRLHMASLRGWMQRHRLDAVIPTDSPAANWSVCRLARATQPQARIIHLVAPQLWAWAPWRIRRMRRLSDHVMCLLPFEPQWFGDRGVGGTFVGHPLFEQVMEARPLELETGGNPKLVLLPGSRRREIEANWPTMAAALNRVMGARDGRPVRPVVALRREADRAHLDPGTCETVVGQTDAALAWADVVLAVSGTVTLQVAAHRKPMVILYNASRLAWHGLGRWLIQTRTFTLPNLLGEHLGLGRRVPELVPHFGAVEPVAAALRPLLEEGDARQRQRAMFDAIHAAYAGVDFAPRAADVVLDQIRARTSR